MKRVIGRILSNKQYCYCCCYILGSITIRSPGRSLIKLMQVLGRRQGDLQVVLRATRFHTYCSRRLLASSRLGLCRGVKQPGDPIIHSTTPYRCLREPPGLSVVSVAPIEGLRQGLKTLCGWTERRRWDRQARTRIAIQSNQPNPIRREARHD